MVPQSRKFVDHFLKDAYVEEEPAEAQDAEKIEKLNKLTDKKDEKVSRKLLDNSRRKRPGVKEGVRALELR